MKNNKLLEQLDSEFEKMSSDLNLKVTLTELDNIFFIKDMILQAGFVSPSLSRMICGRIRDTFNGWIAQMHEWIMPNPYSMIGLSENKLFNDKEKENLNIIIKKFKGFITENVVIGLNKDKSREAKYINSALNVWNESLPKMIEYSEKVSFFWNK